MLLIISLLIDQLGMNSRNSSKVPSTDQDRPEERKTTGDFQEVKKDIVEQHLKKLRIQMISVRTVRVIFPCNFPTHKNEGVFSAGYQTHIWKVYSEKNEWSWVSLFAHCLQPKKKRTEIEVKNNFNSREIIQIFVSF